MSRSKGTSRRSLLRASARAAIGVAMLPQFVPAAAVGRDGQVAPGGRVTVGCIGVGRQGAGLLRNFLGQGAARVVAVCDVNSHRSAAAKRLVDGRYGGTDCAVYKDFRARLSSPRRTTGTY
jgi:threonine dehydrogenase-like Zn-dependent dehydrogenase